MKLTCDVCGNNEALGVAGSALGAVSFAFCRSCLEKKAEPYGMLVITLDMIGGRSHAADWVKPIIEGTLEVAGKSLEELDRDVAESIRKTEEEMAELSKQAQEAPEEEDDLWN